MNVSNPGIMIYQNVKYHFGAKGDGTTDDYASIQAAVDAVDSTYGGRIYFPPGIYRISQAIEITNDGVELVGTGSVSNHAGTRGPTIIYPDLNQSGIIFDMYPTHANLGLVIRRMTVLGKNQYPTGHGTGNGISIKCANHSTFYDVAVENFTEGYGVYLHGGDGSGYTGYTNFYGLNVNQCLYGLYMADSTSSVNMTRLFGCNLDGSGNAASIWENSIGLYFGKGNTLQAYGLSLETFETGAYINAAGGAVSLYSPRFESCELALRVGGNTRLLYCVGAYIDGGTTLSGEIGVQVDSGADDSFIHCVSNWTDTPLSDSGNNTTYIVPGTFSLNGNLVLTDGVASSPTITLTDAATISVDMSLGMNFVVTTTTDRAMGNPSNATEGQSGVFIIKGSDTVTWGNQYYFPGGTAPDTTSGTTIVPYFVESSSVIHCGVGLEGMATT